MKSILNFIVPLSLYFFNKLLATFLLSFLFTYYKYYS